MNFVDFRSFLNSIHSIRKISKFIARWLWWCNMWTGSEPVTGRSDLTILYNCLIFFDLFFLKKNSFWNRVESVTWLKFLHEFLIFTSESVSQEYSYGERKRWIAWQVWNFTLLMKKYYNQSWILWYKLKIYTKSFIIIIYSSLLDGWIILLLDDR